VTTDVQQAQTMSEQDKQQSKGFSALDTDFIRVLEDLIDTLIEKGVLRLTDLPASAQVKLNERKDFRRRLNHDLNLLDDHEHLL